MRNITLSDYKSRVLINLKNCEVFCSDRQCIYAYGNGKIIKSDINGTEVISNLTDKLYPVNDEDIPKAVSIKHFSEKDLLCLILFNGDIITISTNQSDSENVVGTVDSGIKAAQWSPNEEVIVLVTGEDNVIVMSQDFDPISEINLHSGDFGEKQFITVGWGKKETQFRGSEGKFNSKTKSDEKFDVLNEHVDVVKISWRGDGEYFAVSCLNPETRRRYIRIFSNSGILQYTSEDLNGLEHNLDWSSSGSLIASSQILPNKYVVCFFEKNGLKHGEFKLPFNFPEIKVYDVLWNKDSKILALLISKSDNTKYIQLYTVTNYHWCCKYTINFDSLAVPLLIQWDCQKSNTLHVILKRDNDVHYNKYSWLWIVNKSSVKDESLVGVIDGPILKITSFIKGIVPPPLCTHKITLSAPINAVAFPPNVQGISSNTLLVQLSNGDLVFLKIINSKEKNYELVGEIKKFYNDLEFCYNSCWIDQNTLMFCLVKLEKGESKPFLTVLNMENFTVIKRNDIPLQSTVSLIKASPLVVLIHTNDGNLYSFYNNELKLQGTTKAAFIDLEVKDTENGSFNYFAIDNLNKFHTNNCILLSNVISFHIHENFVILTTMKHELLCLNSETELTSNDVSEMCVRRVERGSRVITSVQKDSKVILQMPRGNLECVQPRVLSLFVLGKYLDSCNYFNAFDLMRKQRINLNLLYDHNPLLFSKNVGVFLSQIQDLQWISLFLSELSDEDVTKTMYSVIYKNRTAGDSVSNKISTVCDLIENALTCKNNSDLYILPILMCHIKRGKTESLEAALSKLKSLKEKEQSGVKLPVSFDEAFRYVLYLIDVDELYKVALGMYDFDLVLIIASKSQKDPKEYLEFLNELNQLEPNYQKYRIDKYLKRYQKALSNLVMCEGDDIFNECLNFIKTHKLYKEALKLIPENTDRYKNICMCYGDELIKSHYYEEAGFIYSNAGNYKNAMEAYRKAGNWQEVLLCARELKLDENDLQELYLDLAMELSELKHFRESATVYLDYLINVPDCVRTLCKGKLFSEAYRISYLHNRTDLINEIIEPEITEQGNLLLIHITNIKDTFIKQRDRLQVVRKQKQIENKNEFDDLYSETDTIITQSNASRTTTNRTYRSAKNKRKQERKLLSLKEGSPYEDLALVTSLHNIVTNCMTLKLEIKELNKNLLKIKQNKIAEKLQKDFEDLLKIIEKSKTEIWTPDLLTSKQVYGPESTSNEISSMYMRSENVAPVQLNPKYAVPPETQSNIKWQLEILNS